MIGIAFLSVRTYRQVPITVQRCRGAICWCAHVVVLILLGLSPGLPEASLSWPTHFQWSAKRAHIQRLLRPAVATTISLVAAQHKCRLKLRGGSDWDMEEDDDDASDDPRMSVAPISVEDLPPAQALVTQKRLNITALDLALHTNVADDIDDTQMLAAAGIDVEEIERKFEEVIDELAETDLTGVCCLQKYVCHVQEFMRKKQQHEAVSRVRQEPRMGETRGTNGNVLCHQCMRHVVWRR